MECIRDFIFLAFYIFIWKLGFQTSFLNWLAWETAQFREEKENPVLSSAPASSCSWGVGGFSIPPLSVPRGANFQAQDSQAPFLTQLQTYLCCLRKTVIFTPIWSVGLKNHLKILWSYIDSPLGVGMSSPKVCQYHLISTALDLCDTCTLGLFYFQLRL